MRLSHGIGSSWEDLGEKTRLRLKKAYGKIIADSFLVFHDYDATLDEICRAMRRILSINPFCSDKYSQDLKSGAIEQAELLLRSHGIPTPLPIDGTGLRRLKDEWPSISSKRRRVIRIQKCKEYSLPLTSSWEIVKQKEMQATASKRDEFRADIDNKVQDYASVFRRFSFQNNHNLIDDKLLASLRQGVRAHCESKGYLYIKRWRLQSGLTWYKIGVTNNPDRRGTEQNVLPVPAENIAIVEFVTMEKARHIEKALLMNLRHLKVRGASNRELFEFDDRDLATVMHLLKELKY